MSSTISASPRSDDSPAALDSSARLRALYRRLEMWCFKTPSVLRDPLCTTAGVTAVVVDGGMEVVDSLRVAPLRLGLRLPAVGANALLRRVFFNSLSKRARPPIRQQPLWNYK